MKALELKVPPVAVFLFAAIGMYGASLHSSMQLPLHSYANLIGYFLIGIGIVIGIVGVLTFKRAKTTVNPVSIKNTSSLVTHGIYQYSRNPMYLGLALVLVGLAIYWHANVLLGFVVLFAFVLYMNVFQIIPEERMLSRLFPEEFEAYKRSTRRWM